MLSEWYAELRTAPEVTTWIVEGNVGAFLRHLANVAEYTFDDDDATTIRHGLSATDDEAGVWYDYSFHGERRIDFALARCSPNAGSGLVMVKVTLAGLDDFERGQVGQLLTVMQGEMVRPI